MGVSIIWSKKVRKIAKATAALLLLFMGYGIMQNISGLFHEQNIKLQFHNYKIDHSVNFSSLSPYSLMKVQLLEEGTRKLLERWNKRLFWPFKLTKWRHICDRYTREGAETKVHVSNVWKDDTNDKLLTIVTQLSINKLHVIERLLQHWRGAVSFALYCDEESLRKLPKTLTATNSSLLYRKNIVLHLVYQSGEFYPVNFLRNVALNNTDFKYLMLSDVDFVPSYGSYDYILSLLKEGKLPKKHAFVIPAFEFPHQDKVTDYPNSKHQLLKLWHNGTVQQFHVGFRPGHTPTNYKKWATTSNTYIAKFADAYEPYIVIDREEVPPYPQSFLGRLGDKIAHSLLVHTIGYEFVVLPNAFLIHYPHYVNWQVSYMSCAAKNIQAFKARLKKLYPK